MATVDYVTAASIIDPNVSFGQTSDPTNYASLVWKTAKIPQATLDATWLNAEKARVVALISAEMQKDVTSGFLSDALVSGQFRKYDSDIQGQIAVVGALAYLSPFPGITPPTTYIMSSIDPATGIRGFSPHTYAQIYKLMTDLGIYSSNLVTSLTNKITTIYMTNTGDVHADLDTIYAITWP